MAASVTGAGGPLSVIVFSGDYDRVHYALCLASAAAATGRRATLFFTMGACRALASERGWQRLNPAGNGQSAAARDAAHGAAGLATFDELMDACVGLDVCFMVCEMGLKAEGMTAADLSPAVTVTPGGIVSFLAAASGDGSTTLFV
ncbi:MAG: hypothetical protein AB7G39_18975 [Alphaproteobacteria bacterium]